MYASQPCPDTAWPNNHGLPIACLPWLPTEVQLFNVAWARHELVGDEYTTDLSLRWLEAGGTKSPKELGL